MSYIIKESDNPKDIANLVFILAENERYEVIEENAKRAEKLQEPLPIPSWNLDKMLKNVETIVNKRFSNPRYGDLNPWDGKRSAKEWIKISTKFLRDHYLLREAKDDPDLFKQMCKKWEELTPDPELTKEQTEELINLQKQADDIIRQAEDLVEQFKKLVEREASIVIGTQSKWDRRIVKQIWYLAGHLPLYHEGYIPKWRR